MYTSTTRIAGLFSGMDTEGLIQNMMRYETAKLQRVQRSQTTNVWKQEMYRSAYNDLLSFQQKHLRLSAENSLRWSGTFKANSTTVKTSAGQDSNAVTVGSGAPVGKYTVKVEQLAAADLYESTSRIGGDIKSAQDFAFDVSNIKEGSSYEIKLDGVSKKISFKEGDTVAGGTLTFANGVIGVIAADGDDTPTPLTEQQFINIFNEKLKNAFGTEGTGTSAPQKIEAKLTGVDGAYGISIFTNGYHTGFSIADGEYLSSSAIAEGSCGSDARDLEFDIKYNGAELATLKVAVTDDMTPKEIADALNEELSEKGLASMAQFGVDETTGNIKLTGGSLTGDFEVRDGENGIGSLAYLGFGGDDVTLAATSPLSALGITSGSAAKFNTDRTLSEIFGGELTSDTSFTINGKTFSFTGETKLSDLMKEVNDADLGVTLRYDELNQTFQLESNSTGYANKIEFSGQLLTDNLGFGTEAKRAAQDSVATINGMTVTNPTNEYKFIDIDWTLNKATDGDELTVTVARDVDGIMDTIKNFVNDYNTMIDGLKSLTNTSRPKSNGGRGDYYDPLLDEEKAEMSEAQINQWESLAKTGLLYRDSILSGITTQLRSALYQPVKLDDGSSIWLSDIGITTGEGWEPGQSLKTDGKLVINEDKLRKAIEERGEDVMTLFTKFTEDENHNTPFAEQGIAEKVNIILSAAVSPNGAIADKAGIVGYRSEHDNLLSKAIRSQSESIILMYERLAAKETRYYNMFSRMEVNLSKMESQLSQLQSVMGTSSS